MSYREWRRWLGQLPWALRWFMILILVRPAIETLFFLKHISPFLSPLYIVGVLTPLLIVASLFSRNISDRATPSLDWPFFVWGGLMILNAVAVLTIRISFLSAEIALKLATPILIYYFLRHLIQTSQDLSGVLTTFLYSTIIPFGMMVYELTVSPLAPHESSVQFTRGFTRYAGLYGDVASYGNYFIGAFLVSSFLFLHNDGRESLGTRTLRLVSVGTLLVLGLVHIHHAGSYGVAAALFALLVYHVITSGRLRRALIVLSFGLGIAVVGGGILSNRVTAITSTEVSVVEGKAGPQRAFHGRMHRWTTRLDEWENTSMAAKALGVSVSANRLEESMLFGIHNDYLRMIFSSGIIGLLFYLLFFLSLLVSTRQRTNPEKFLIRGAILVILLYSISNVPTLQFPLIYLCFPIFAYAVLPSSNRQARPWLSVRYQTARVSL